MAFQLDNSLQVNLEAFQTNLHGGRILLQGPFEVGKYPPILEAIQNIREPFKRKVLLTSHSDTITNKINLSYDTIFRIQGSLDWSLALNYIQHLIGQSGGCTPLLIIVEDIEIPDAFFTKLSTGVGNKVTILHYISHTLRNRPNLGTIYDTIFFPFQGDIGAQSSQNMFNILLGIFRPSWTFQEFKEILTEIRAAGAGLCWTRMGGKNGNIYWYDPVQSMRAHELDRNKIINLLKWVADELV